ncbi:interleukin-18 receptor accessory protein [Otolemur garnettii]|nr:interleukin-18 receptor accessory protein [Otolemur garnettii]
MLYLAWLFLWLVTGERMERFNSSECYTKNLLWIPSKSEEEEFILFCDLPELQKSHFCPERQCLPAQTSEHLPCGGSKDLSDVQWSLQLQNGDYLQDITESSPHIRQEKNSLHFSTRDMNISGSYVCRPRNRSPQDVACCVKTVLEVKLQKNASCDNSVLHEQYLLLGSISSIHCPSLSCQSGVQSPEVTWYENGRLSEQRSNPLVVGEVYDYHQGMYVCDYTQSDNASVWTVRSVVQVITIVKDTNFKPDILDPVKDTQEVELGKPLTISCRVRFGFERVPKYIIRWYVKDSERERDVLECENKRIRSTLEDEVFECDVILKKVTQSDLRKKFVCFAQNSLGNSTWSIQLKEKRGVLLLYVLLGTVVTLVGVLAVSVLLYQRWIEIVLLFRTYQSKDETLGDKKEFDAFISYAKWSSFESESASSVSEEYLALNLFPEVLENKYGYTLCLLERDVAPGGVYAEDIIDVIQKSRRGIFILSPNYINGPCVFELQAAVNLALADQTLKLILIKFSSFQEPESLPYLVKKALRVLPTVTWKGLKSVPPNSRFWTEMHYHMPVKNSKGFSWNQLRIIPRFLNLERTQ